MAHDPGFDLRGGRLAERAPPGEPLQQHDFAGEIRQAHGPSRRAIGEREIGDGVADGIAGLGGGARRAEKHREQQKRERWTQHGGEWVQNRADKAACHASQVRSR